MEHLSVTETQSPGVSGQFLSAGPLSEEASVEEVDLSVWVGEGSCSPPVSAWAGGEAGLVWSGGISAR